MTKTISAEELKKGDVIVIPASTIDVEKKYKVISTPVMSETTVSFLAKMLKGKTKQSDFMPQTQLFGRKVDLDKIILTLKITNHGNNRGEPLATFYTKTK
jgi:hypothetical protein